MAWPLSQDYNEAIQDSLGSFSDPELRQGEVVSNALGLPMPRSGNFADVYEVRSGDGRTRWAVKCFTRQVVGLRERYSEISKYLRQVQLPFMVDFQYLEQGIRVRGQWYPVLKMHWVEGLLLNEFVRDNLDKPVLLRGLGQIWLRMARKIREAKLAHCDLQHGNVILVPGSTASSLAVKLIDYDGMFVPALAGSKSGEVGHPAYQHPQRLQTGAYHAEVDRFPLLVIATAMQALAVAGRPLWERFDNGDNLLFRQADLQDPARSGLFAELRQVRDPLTQTLVTQLEQACGQPLERAPLLEKLYPEEKVATAPRASAARTAAATPKAAAAAGDEWDFSSPAAGVSANRRRRGTPGWVWALAGAAAALLLVVGAAGAFWMLMGKSGPTVAQQSDTGRKKATTQLARATDLGQKDPDRKKPADQDPDRPPPANPPRNPGDEHPEPPEPQPADNLSQPGHRLQTACTNGLRLIAWASPQARSWNMMELAGKLNLRPFNGHTAAVTCIAVCKDGKRALSGSADGTLRLWDCANAPSTLHTLEGHGRAVTCVAVSPDGRRAASADGSPDVLLWDLEKGEKIRSLRHHRGVCSLSFSDDGSKVLSGLERPNPPDAGAVDCMWHSLDAPDARGDFRLHLDQAATAFAMSSDEQWAAVGGAGMLWIVRLRGKGAEVQVDSLQARPLGAQAGTVHRIVFSKDSQRFVVSADKAASLWRVDGSQLLVRQYPAMDQLSASFTENEQQMLLAKQHGGTVQVELANVPPQRQPSGEPARPAGNKQVYPDLFQVTSTPTAQWMAWTREHGKSWELMDPNRIKYPPFEGHTDAVLCLAWSDDGKRMLTGSADRTARLWTLGNEQKPLHTFEGHTQPVTSVAISPDGRWGASADGGPDVLVWDLDKQEKLHTLTNPRGVRSLAFEPTGAYLLCGLDEAAEPNRREACCRWDIASGARAGRVLLRQRDAVTCMAISPDGERMVAGGENTFTIVPLGKTRKFIRPIALERELGPAHHIVFSRDSQRFLVSAEKAVYLCGINGMLLLVHRRPEKDRLCACFSPDERKIFLAHRQSEHLHNQLLDLPTTPAVVVNPTPPVRPRPPGPRPVEKLPVPDKAEVKAAREKVRQEYKDDYARLKQDASGKATDELSQTLMQRGGKQEEAPLYRYALLREAYDLAVGKPDLGRAFWAVTVMDNAFTISPLAEHAAAVEAAARSPQAQRNPFLLDKALEVVEEAISEDDYVRADRLMTIALAAGQQNRGANTQALVLQRSRRLQTLRKEYKRVEAAVKKLAKAPDDAEACLAVGKFECFQKGDWQRGLPLLEKGSDKLLALLARGDLGVGEDTRNQVGFGDMWWEQADKDGPNRELIRERARYWYRRALPKLEGEDKARAEKRLSLSIKTAVFKPGLVAELFADNNLKDKVVSRVDYRIDFKWDARSPDVQVPAEAFSVRWTGWLLLPESGNQHLHIWSKGGFRILLDGKVVNDQWNTKEGNHGMGFDMAAGPHLFQVEFRKAEAPAEIHLGWTHPLGKKGVPNPIELLYHDRQQEKSLDLPRKKP